MTKDQLHQYLNRLDLAHVEAAQLLGVSARTVLRWLDGEDIPGPVEQAFRAWLKLHEQKLPWRPDSASIMFNNQEQIRLIREHDIELNALLERVKARGGARLPWEVDRFKCRAVLGQMEVSFYKLRNGSFSLAHYTRKDEDPDVQRDWEFIEDAAYCIALALRKEPSYGPVTLVYFDKPPKGGGAQQTLEAFDTNELAMNRVFSLTGTANFSDPFIMAGKDDEVVQSRSDLLIWNTRELQSEYQRQQRIDFEIKALGGGEYGISALSERAQKTYRIKAGHTLAFKSLGEMIPYIDHAEAQGYFFKGKEAL